MKVIKPELTEEEAHLIMSCLYSRKEEINRLLERSRTEDIRTWCADKLSYIDNIIKKVGEAIL
jgi:hypothetical protein